MNVLIYKNKINYYEGIWRKSINHKKYDIINRLFPFPKKSKNKISKKYLDFINKLKKIQLLLENNQTITKYKIKKKCLFTNNILPSYKLYNLYNVNWDNTLIYYMKTFNIKPSKDFYNFINSISINNNNNIKLSNKYKYKYFKIKTKIYIKYNAKYLLFTENMIRIMDALYHDGSNRHYKYKNSYKYSEHSGLIDFNHKSIDKIIVNAKENYIDPHDDIIFLPHNIDHEEDYEFIFHTHPKTKDRLKDNIIYEFPSISDIINFSQNYNEGKTQGSIVVAPEGLYIIHAIDNNYKVVIPNLDEEFILENLLFEIHEESIKKYTKKFTKKIYYNKIIKDKRFLYKYNKLLIKLNIKIKYYYRIKKNNNYIIPKFTLKFNVIEPIL